MSKLTGTTIGRRKKSTHRDNDLVVNPLQIVQASENPVLSVLLGGPIQLFAGGYPRHQAPNFKTKIEEQINPCPCDGGFGSKPFTNPSQIVPATKNPVLMVLLAGPFELFAGGYPRRQAPRLEKVCQTQIAMLLHAMLTNTMLTCCMLACLDLWLFTKCQAKLRSAVLGMRFPLVPHKGRTPSFRRHTLFPFALAADDKQLLPSLLNTVHDREGFEQHCSDSLLSFQEEKYCHPLMDLNAHTAACQLPSSTPQDTMESCRSDAKMPLHIGFIKRLWQASQV